MTAIVFYFQVHQPRRIRPYHFFDIGHNHFYFDDISNQDIFRRVAEKCYLPMNQLLMRLIKSSYGNFRCAFSISGCALKQMQEWAPDVLSSFVELAQTGNVEFLAETSHHSLSSLYSTAEFSRQICEHAALVETLFSQKPRVFRNTELVLNNSIARTAEKLGYHGILGEGADRLLGWRSPHHLYRPEGTENIKMLLRSYRLSDDIAFRFSDRGWNQWPLNADRFAHWLNQVPHEDPFVGLFMDYETFGEHQWEDTGIFSFFEHLPPTILRNPRFHFATPSMVVDAIDPIARLNISDPISWADEERDLTAWLGNSMQRAASEALYRLEPSAIRAAGSGQPELLEIWRCLSTSDHVYYMCTKYDRDGDVHKYFSPHSSPYEAFISFMNIIDDLGRQLGAYASSEVAASA